MTKTEATRRAADLAAQISADNETAHGLALALETLTAAGDESPAGRYNAAARRAQAAAVLQALADQLDRMQAAADQLEEITMQLAQPGRLSPADDQSGAALCAQESAKMWYAYRDEVRAQIDDHDRRHAEPAQGGAAR